jgi:hypothetical protein
MAATDTTGRSTLKQNSRFADINRFEGILEANDEIIESDNEDFSLSDTPIIHNVPSEICADSLLGKVPQSANILRTEVIERLTSKYEWKSIRAILTAGCLYLTRTDEDLVRDLIPLCEVVSIRRIDDVLNKCADGDSDIMLARSGTMRNVQLSAFLDGSAKRDCVLQLQTMEDGFNSGRTYYFAAPTDAACRAWEVALRTAVETVIRTRTVSSLVGRLRLQLRRPASPNQTLLMCSSTNPQLCRRRPAAAYNPPTACATSAAYTCIHVRTRARVGSKYVCCEFRSDLIPIRNCAVRCQPQSLARKLALTAPTPPSEHAARVERGSKGAREQGRERGSEAAW